MIKTFLMQLKFLTRFPFFKVEFDEERFARGIIFAPVIGLLIGGVYAGLYLALSALGNDVVTAIVLVFAGVVITGGLHIDGLADTCDGLFSGRGRERILEIMKDSRIGTNGTIGIILLLGFKVILFASLGKIYFLYYLLVFPVIARNNIVIASGISKYAREENGMGRSIVNRTGIKEMVISSIMTLVICIPILRIESIVYLFACTAFVLLFTSYVKFKIGGITGDIIGAIIELSEVIFLATAFVIESPLFREIWSYIF